MDGPAIAAIVSSATGVGIAVFAIGRKLGRVEEGQKTAVKNSENCANKVDSLKGEVNVLGTTVSAMGESINSLHETQERYIRCNNGFKNDIKELDRRVTRLESGAKCQDSQ